MPVVVIPSKLGLHLFKDHIAAVFPFWEPIDTEHATVVAGFPNVDFNISSRVPLRVERLIVGGFAQGSIPSNVALRAVVGHNSAYLSNTPEHTRFRVQALHAST